MALIEWSESLSVGIETIDEQHKRLIALINELHTAMLERRAKDVMGHVFDELIEYTKSHFALEEQLFQEHGYPEEAAHVADHHRIAKKVLELKQEFDEGNTAVTLEVMRFLRDWFGNHIVGTDKKYAPFLTSKGVV